MSMDQVLSHRFFVVDGANQFVFVNFTVIPHGAWIFNELQLYLNDVMVWNQTYYGYFTSTTRVETPIALHMQLESEDITLTFRNTLIFREAVQWAEVQFHEISRATG